MAAIGTAVLGVFPNRDEFVSHREAMGQCMKERGEGKKLVGAAPAQKLFVYALFVYALQNSRQQKCTGLHGTSGAVERRGCLNSNAKAAR